jgi:5-methylcytosine-specific restriction protein A
MASMPKAFRPAWMPASGASERKIVDDRRGSAAARGYDHRWQAASASHLRRSPLCVCCLAQGVTRAAMLVDHVLPAQQRPALFWVRSNWQSLCRSCHGLKRSLEVRWIKGQVGDEALRLDRVRECGAVF